MSLWDTLLQGQSPFGSSGIDVMNTLAQSRNGQTNGQIDPRLLQYFNVGYQGSEAGSSTPNFTPTGPFDQQGFINQGGQNYVQVAGIPDDQRIVNRDPSMFHYDPKGGLLTSASNVNVPSSMLDNIMPLLVGGALAGPAIGAALGGSAGAAAEGADWVPSMGNQLAGAGEGVGGGAGASVESADWQPSLGSSGSNYAPVTDLSTTSGMPATQAPAPVTDLSTGGSPFSQLLNGNYSGAASGLLSGAMHNPLQALGMLQAASGLLGRHGPTSSSTNAPGAKPQGGTGVPTTQSARAPWQPNPVTAMQLAQLYGGH